MMNSQELETAARLQTPFVVLVFNDPAASLGPALHAALSSNQLTTIDCPVDTAENLRLTLKLGPLAAPGSLRSADDSRQMVRARLVLSWPAIRS